MTAVIMFLTMVFDLADKLNDFLQAGATAHQIIFDYFFNFMLLYANMFSSLIIFVSVIWFTSKMAQDTEIIPIWNSGRTFGRFVRPYMIAATFLMLLSLLLNHFIVPRANKVRLAFEEEYYWNNMQVNDYHAEFPGEQVVYFSNYTSESGIVSDFVVEQWNEKGEMVSFLKAKTAKNEPGSDIWTLNNYFERKTSYPKDEIVTGKKLDTTFAFSIDEMATRANVAEAMTYFELKEFIQREKDKGSKRVPTYEVVLYERTSLPFSTYILTIIGIAVASRKKRGGIGINIAIGLAIIFIYIFAMKVTSVAAMNVGFPSYLAVWVPNVLFGAVAYYLYRKVQR
ncbi:MAG: permease [Bacteroidetes bacterium]|nr:MAG: permease [Bacteroidota bacterium]